MILRCSKVTSDTYNLPFFSSMQRHARHPRTALSPWPVSHTAGEWGGVTCKEKAMKKEAMKVTGHSPGKMMPAEVVTLQIQDFIETLLLEEHLGKIVWKM